MVDSQAKVTNCILESNINSAVRIERSGQLVLRDNLIRYNKNGIVGTGDYRLEVIGSTFERNGKGLYISTVSPNTLISDNIFLDNEYAIQVEKRTRAKVTKNRFENNKYGVYIDNQSKTEVTNNIFTKNEQAITCVRMSSPSIRQNEFYDNKVAIACFLGSYPKINYNNFYRNDTNIKLRFLSADWGIQAGLSKRLLELNATRNWWGSQITKLIEEKGNDFNRPDIFDGYDVPYNQDRGLLFQKQKVNYSDWLTEKIKLETLPKKTPVDTKGKGQ